MKFPEKIVVTDQEISLVNLSNEQKKYFVTLSKNLEQKYIASGKDRFVISLSGSSGSGKSTLSILLQELLKDSEHFDFVSVDLDAFHYSNEKLQEKDLINVKGRSDTYDVKNLISLTKKFKDGEVVQFPIYSRIHHEPSLNGQTIERKKSILLLAGLWFQRKDTIWNEIRNEVDLSLEIKISDERIKANTVNRHVKGGRSLEEAAAFYEKSDSANNTEILNNSIPADESILYFEDIQP